MLLRLINCRFIIIIIIIKRQSPLQMLPDGSDVTHIIIILQKFLVCRCKMWNQCTIS